ncbi:MAG TPA: DUF3175 domain-containing protein [Steroidobacteraceae bacterium]|nr:DUF3175 domain-containing protein [Steroidobacteraceae bacterium]
MAKAKGVRRTANGRKSARRWSKGVNEHSDALDLEASVFKSRSAKHIAQSLKHSAEASKRRKATPYQSAMSMLNFYINRGGSNLPASRKAVLERAKGELRRAFGRPA